jgi:urease accessory protein
VRPADLRLLRLADSAFPGGGFAFSSGLEGAVADGLVVTEGDLVAFVREHVALRWHRHDRVLLRAAWPADGRPAGPAREAADHQAETSTPLSWLRDASRKAGRALLGTFAALGSDAAAEHLARVGAGSTHGHLPVAQAVCYRSAGTDRADAEALAAWHAASGIVSAGLRLGLVGHLGAQRTLAALEPSVADVLATAPPPMPGGFSAFAEIASGRTRRTPRMFAS